MKTAILLLLISVLQLSAATVSFSNIPATNVVKAADLLLLDSALGGTNYSTRTLTVSNLANVVAAPVGTVVASGTPASTNIFFAPSDLTGTNAVPRAIVAADIATSIVTGKQTNATLASLGGVTTNAPNIAAGSIAAFSASNALGVATSAQLSNAIGGTVFLPIAGGNLGGSISTPELIISNITASTFAYFDANKMLTNAPFSPQPTNAVLTQTSTNTYDGTGHMVLASAIPANQTNVAAANPTATLTSSIQNGSATTFMRSDGAPALPQELSTTSNPTFALVNSSEIFFGGARVSRGTLTHAAGNVIVDFAQTNRFWSCTITGNVTFVLTNAAAGKWANILLYNTQATNCTPTFNFPAGTTNFFGGAPSTLTAGTVGWLTYASIDTITNSIKAWYTETQ